MTAASTAELGLETGPRSMGRADAQRLRELVELNHDFVWRLLRRMGLGDADCDDATQQVFIAASRKLYSLEAGRERAFLISAAWSELGHARRGHARSREVPAEDSLQHELDAGSPADELLGQQRARALLDEVLIELSPELRAVFVLFEIEDLSTKEIAQMLGIPVGTAASRLRRARDEFNERLAQKQLAMSTGKFR